MVKYRVTYNSVTGEEYICNIYNDDYSGDVIEVGGYCVLDYPKIDSVYQVIRGAGMRITLEANEGLTLEDLYSNGDKENQVTLTRDGVNIFRGFIDPAGLYEDLVNGEWEVTLDCVDGLGLLEDLSYVNQTGEPFTGVLSDIEVINNCLKRTGVTLEDGSQMLVTTSINTRYEPRNLNTDPLNTTFSNQERFYKDDGETIMSCKEVLESTLRKYGGVIKQAEGQWHVFSFYELASNPQRRFTTYRDGVYVSDELTSYDTQNIVTFNGFNPNAPHWVNGNQRKEIIPPLGAVRVNYKYGFVNSLVKNLTFENDGTSIDQWNILEPTGLTLESERYISILSSNNEDSMVVANIFDVSQDDNIQINYSYNLPLFFNETYFYRTYFRIGLRLTDGTAEYWLKSDGSWVTSSSFYQSYQDVTFQTDVTQIFEVKPDPLPITGEIHFTILRPYCTRYSNTTGEEASEQLVRVTEAKITAVQDASIQGETHTQQLEGKNTRAEDVIEVTVGDTPSDIYNGALYKADGVTNTNFWGTTFMALDFVNPQTILEILSEEIAKQYKTPKYKVTGDVYGYFNPIKMLTLDLVNDKVFMLSSYSLDTKTNVNSCEFIEIKQVNSFGLTYEFAYDYGNVQKPTIVG